MQKTKVFISYSRKDQAFVTRLVNALETRDDIQVFRDTEDILPSEEWRKRLRNLIGEADAIVFCLSPESATSLVCDWEVAESEKLNKRITPIVLRDVSGPVPGGLEKLNYIFFTERDDFGRALDKLILAIGTNINWIREHTRIGELSRQWSASGKSADKLLRGADILSAEKWLNSQPLTAPAPTEITVLFLKTSQTDDKLRVRRSQRVAAAVVALAASLVGIAGLSYAGYLDESYLRIHARKFADVHLSSHLVADREMTLKQRETFQECASCPEMVVVPAGEFTMGFYADNNARPVHKVTIASRFAVGRFAVTFDEWDGCVAHGACAYLPGDNGWGRGRRPVINVSWDDLKLYLDWLSKQTGKQYRLLTEAEFEFSARAGAATAYSWGNDIGKGNANCGDCGSQWDSAQPAPVGSFKANAFGLYDMQGNISQWVQDCSVNDYKDAPADGEARVVQKCDRYVHRGGSWAGYSFFLMSHSRGAAASSSRQYDLGFRVARTLLPTSN